jgi:5,10-methylenetetrahydrofolate reductase
VPDRLIQQMADAESKAEASVAIGAELARGFKDLCQGVHVMAIGWEKHVPALLDAAGL